MAAPPQLQSTCPASKAHLHALRLLLLPPHLLRLLVQEALRDARPRLVGADQQLPQLLRRHKGGVGEASAGAVWGASVLQPSATPGNQKQRA